MGNTAGPYVGYPGFESHKMFHMLDGNSVCQELPLNVVMPLRIFRTVAIFD
jgi:hypothetical protein